MEMEGMLSTGGGEFLNFYLRIQLPLVSWLKWTNACFQTHLALTIATPLEVPTRENMDYS